MLLLLIILLAYALRLVGLDRQDIWWDEARNIDVALRPFFQVAVAPELDIHPPVYFWLLHGWARLHNLQPGLEAAQMAFVTRLLSVSAGVVSVALLYQLARQVGDHQLGERGRLWGAGVLAATVGAFSPFWLAESQETRMYTVGFALILGAGVALLMALRRRSKAPLVWFVVCSVLALLTHYNAVFIFAAWYGAWFVWALMQRQRKQMVAIVLLCGLAVALLVAPVAPIALRQIPVYSNPNLTVPTVAGYLAQNWQAYWGGYAWGGVAQEPIARVWLATAVVLGVIGIVIAWSKSAQRTPLAFLLVWIVGGLALYYVAVLDRGAFNVRYSSFTTPPLYALMGIALAAWGGLWRPLIVVTTVAALALWPQAIYADLYDERFGREDIAGVTAWLRQHAGPEAVIFVDQKYPFGFYYGRYAIDVEATPVGQEAAPAHYLFVDINIIDQRLAEWAADAEEIYWVQWFESDTDPRRAVPFLLDQQGERGGEENFQGYSVDWWQLSPPNHFVLAPKFTPLTVTFPPAVQTVELSLPTEAITVGGEVPVVIRWQRVPGGEAARPLKARVALYHANGDRISQRDERLLNDRHLMPAEWSLDDRPLNVYLLEVDDEVAPGDYTIGLLVYDADTLEPLGVSDGAGNAAGVEATIGRVQVVGE